MATVQFVFGIVLSILLGFIILIIVGLMIARMYSPLQVGTLLIDKPVKMDYNMTTCSGRLLTSGSEHTYVFWFFINQFETSQNKRLFIRSHKQSKKLLVEIDGGSPNLTVTILDVDDNPVVDETENGNDGVYKIQNIRLQGWNHVALSIYDKTLDMYLNGKLVRSFILTTNLLSDQDNGITVGGDDSDLDNIIPTINGFMSRFYYFPRVLSPREIYRMYLRGPAPARFLSSDIDSKIGSEIVFGGDNSPDCDTADD